MDFLSGARSAVGRSFSRLKWSHLRKVRPSSFGFLTLHYIYIVGMVLLGSLLVFAGGEIRYIDALFLASSSCTQAGLATLNINSLNTWQQFMFFFLASITNPIVIHSATAFVRLYWFQRRFAHIVHETRLKLSLRKSKSRGINASDLEEKGVGGREIRVLFNEGRTQPAVLENEEVTRSSSDPVRRRKSSAGTGERIKFSNTAHQSSTSDDGKDPLIPGDSAQISTNSESEVTSSKAGSQTPVSHPEFAVIDDDEKFTIDTERKPTVDIKFAALPMPRKEQSDGGQAHRLSSFSQVQSVNIDNNPGPVRSKTDVGPRTLASTLLEFGQRTMTMEGPNNARIHRRRPSTASRLGAQSTTLDRTFSTAFRRRRDSSIGSRPARSELPLPYISFQPTIGRNSAFISLTKEQRAELGGIEYRATKALCWVLVLYYFGFHIFGFICYIIFIFTAQTYIPVINNIGVSRGWWSVFTSASSFNDLGLTLTPDSFVSFQNAAFLLLLSSFLIVSGNTGFPCVLRFIIWFAHKLTRHDSPLREEFAFLLDHPRRCFTLLFPSAATWWLLAILVIFNGIDLILFIVLDINDDTVSSIPPGYRWIAGLFQAFCTRTAGFTVVNLAGLHSAVLVSYMIMMYISVFPVAISIRRTNVYEERSLGIYSAEDDGEGNNESFVGTHIRRQLGFDLWYVFLALFIICIIENPEIQAPDLQSFNIFSVLFEIVSAYGTVGLSLGFPGTDYSFSGQFHTLSKLVIIALQIRGRHRGLPLKLDRAILLPSEKLIAKEEEDAELRAGQLRRSISIQPGYTANTTTRERQS